MLSQHRDRGRPKMVLFPARNSPRAQPDVPGPVRHGITHEVANGNSTDGVSGVRWSFPPRPVDSAMAMARRPWQAAAAGVFQPAPQMQPRPCRYTEEAMAAYGRGSDPIAYVSIGGGSTIGLGKAIALPHQTMPQNRPCPPPTPGVRRPRSLARQRTAIKDHAQSNPKIQPEVILITTPRLGGDPADFR